MERKPTPKGCLVFAVCGSLMLLVVSYLMMTHKGDPSYAEREKNYLLAKQVLEQDGVTTRLKDHLLEITLPHEIAMSITERQANELALIGKSRVGIRTIVLSPAGQILGEAK